MRVRQTERILRQPSRRRTPPVEGQGAAVADVEEVGAGADGEMVMAAEDKTPAAS